MPTAPKLSSRKVQDKSDPTQSGQRVSKKTQAVLRVARLPKEFGEKELRQFFGQFGQINKLKLSRSKKTGRSRGYGYLQYELPEIAQIAAEASHNYFIAGKPLIVEHMNPEAVLPSHLKGWNKKPVAPRKLMEMNSALVRKCHNSKAHSALDVGVVTRDAARKAKLEAAGIEYEFVRPLSAKRPQEADA